MTLESESSRNKGLSAAVELIDAGDIGSLISKPKICKTEEGICSLPSRYHKMMPLIFAKTKIKRNYYDRKNYKRF